MHAEEKGVKTAGMGMGMGAMLLLMMIMMLTVSMQLPNKKDDRALAFVNQRRAENEKKLEGENRQFSFKCLLKLQAQNTMHSGFLLEDFRFRMHFVLFRVILDKPYILNSGFSVSVMRMCYATRNLSFTFIRPEKWQVP